MSFLRVPQIEYKVDYQTECPYSLEPLDNTARETPCGHFINEDSIEGCQNQCPICREPFDEDDLELATEYVNLINQNAEEQKKIDDAKLPENKFQPLFSKSFLIEAAKSYSRIGQYERTEDKSPYYLSALEHAKILDYNQVPLVYDDASFPAYESKLKDDSDNRTFLINWWVSSEQSIEKLENFSNQLPKEDFSGKPVNCQPLYLINFTHTKTNIIEQTLIRLEELNIIQNNEENPFNLQYEIADYIEYVMANNPGLYFYQAENSTNPFLKKLDDIKKLPQFQQLYANVYGAVAVNTVLLDLAAEFLTRPIWIMSVLTMDYYSKAKNQLFSDLLLAQAFIEAVEKNDLDLARSYKSKFKSTPFFKITDPGHYEFSSAKSELAKALIINDKIEFSTYQGYRHNVCLVYYKYQAETKSPLDYKNQLEKSFAQEFINTLDELLKPERLASMAASGREFKNLDELNLDFAHSLVKIIEDKKLDVEDKFIKLGDTLIQQLEKSQKVDRLFYNLIIHLIEKSASSLIYFGGWDRCSGSKLSYALADNYLGRNNPIFLFFIVKFSVNLQFKLAELKAKKSMSIGMDLELDFEQKKAEAPALRVEIQKMDSSSDDEMQVESKGEFKSEIVIAAGLFGEKKAETKSDQAQPQESNANRSSLS